MYVMGIWKGSGLSPTMREVQIARCAHNLGIVLTTSECVGTMCVCVCVCLLRTAADPTRQAVEQHPSQVQLQKPSRTFTFTPVGLNLEPFLSPMV